MKIQNKICLLIAIICCYSSVQAQDNFDVNVQAKSMHYWRGLRVTEAVMTGTSVGYFGDNLSVYAWGGLSVDGKYKEVTNIISYKKGNFKVTLCDIYNFSGATNPDYFNYKKEETLHFIDLEVAYSFSFMNLSVATVIYGNDRELGDVQKYSTYVNMSFPIKLEKVTVTPYISPAFALNGDAKTMLYGDDNFGIANVGLIVGKTLTFADKKFPVAATLGYNVVLDQASVQLAVNLF